jgi:hypothetical protein
MAVEPEGVAITGTEQFQGQRKVTTGAHDEVKKIQMRERNGRRSSLRTIRLKEAEEQNKERWNTTKWKGREITYALYSTLAIMHHVIDAWLDV